MAPNAVRVLARHHLVALVARWAARDRGAAADAAVQPASFCSASHSHGTDRPNGFGRLRFVPLLELLRTLAHVHLSRRPAQGRDAGGMIGTGPSGSRLAPGHRNGRRGASGVRPPLPSRTASKGSSMSRRGRALSPPAAYSEPLGISTTQTCGSVSRLRGRERSRREPHGCARLNILLRR
jgi:hypothetical protein